MPGQPTAPHARETMLLSALAFLIVRCAVSPSSIPREHTDTYRMAQQHLELLTPDILRTCASQQPCLAAHLCCEHCDGHDRRASMHRLVSDFQQRQGQACRLVCSGCWCKADPG